VLQIEEFVDELKFQSDFTPMNAFIPTRDDLEKIVHKAVEKAVNDSLPSAIRRGTRPRWLKTCDVMEILQCTRRHVQHLRDSGRLPYHQNRRTIRYDIDEVEAYLNRGKINSQQ